jgi:hypothetical protein
MFNCKEKEEKSEVCKKNNNVEGHDYTWKNDYDLKNSDVDTTTSST